MPTRPTLPAWNLLARWIAASLAGWGAGLTVGILLGRVLPGLDSDRAVTVLILACLALANGIAQAALLRGALPAAGRWIPATFGGYLLVLAVAAGASAVRMPATGLVNNAALLLLAGLAAGLPQWVLLRRRYPAAALWLPASLTLFLGFVWPAAFSPFHALTEFILGGTLLGTLGALLPGLALAWMARGLRPAVAQTQP